MPPVPEQREILRVVAGRSGDAAVAEVLCVGPLPRITAPATQAATSAAFAAAEQAVRDASLREGLAVLLLGTTVHSVWRDGARLPLLGFAGE